MTIGIMAILTMMVCVFWKTSLAVRWKHAKNGVISSAPLLQLNLPHKMPRVSPSQPSGPPQNIPELRQDLLDISRLQAKSGRKGQDDQGPEEAS